jgi:hypothetical protein
MCFALFLNLPEAPDKAQASPPTNLSSTSTALWLGPEPIPSIWPSPGFTTPVALA